MMNVEEKIQMLADIRHEIKTGSYRYPMHGRANVIFLLDLIDELTDALFKIHAAIAEAQKHDPNIDPGSKHDPDTLAS
jgi:hypothetical protein